MTRFPLTALFFLLATLISHVFALPHPLLRRDAISQLQADIQTVTGDVTNLNVVVTRPAWQHTLAQEGNLVNSAFSTTSKDIQKCITDVNGITSSLSAASANIILKLAQDLANTVTQMLSGVRNQYPSYKKENLALSILTEVRNLSSGVEGMTGKLKSVLPPQSQGVANGVQQQMGDAFQQTIALYSSS